MQKEKTSKPASGGLAGVTIADSQISLVDGEQGRLIYRGYDINDLAEQSTFEETAYLLWHGALPTRSELDEFSSRLAAQRALPDEAMDVLRKVASGSTPIGALRTTVSILGNLDPDAEDDSDESRRRVAGRLLAAFPTVVAAHARLNEGREPVDPKEDGSIAANFLHMLRGEDASEDQARAVDVALILHADHEFNASTFAARVTASTLSDIYSAVTTAVGTLKGPLHGGANREVMKALESIDDVDAVEAFVQRKLDAHEKIMGFGHRVYKVMDPRAKILKRWSKTMGEAVGDTTYYDMSARMQDVVEERKGLFPNVDFYTASLYHSLDIPRAAFPAIFAMSRVSGWLAHVLEQYDTNKLIRPLSNYVGPTGLDYVPADDRS